VKGLIIDDPLGQSDHLGREDLGDALTQYWRARPHWVDQKRVDVGHWSRRFGRDFTHTIGIGASNEFCQTSGSRERDR
jgi:hypothetical protein